MFCDCARRPAVLDFVLVLSLIVENFCKNKLNESHNLNDPYLFGYNFIPECYDVLPEKDLLCK